MSAEAMPAEAQEEQWSKDPDTAGPWSPTAPEAAPSPLMQEEQDALLMSHDPVSIAHDSVLLPPAVDMHASGDSAQSADLPVSPVSAQPDMTKDESEVVMTGEVDTILDELTSTAGVEVPVESDDSLATPDAAVDTDSIMDRLLIDTVDVEAESQHEQLSGVPMMEVEEENGQVEPAGAVADSSPEALVTDAGQAIAPQDTDNATDRLGTETSGVLDPEQQAELPQAEDADTDSLMYRLVEDVSMDNAPLVQQEEGGSTNPEAGDVDELVDDLVSTAPVTVPAHSETDAAAESDSEAEGVRTDAVSAQAEAEAVSPEPMLVSAQVEHEHEAVSTETQADAEANFAASVTAEADLIHDGGDVGLSITEQSETLMTRQVESVLDDLLNTDEASEPVQSSSKAVNEPEALEDKSVLELISDVADAPDTDEAADTADAADAKDAADAADTDEAADAADAADTDEAADAADAADTADAADAAKSLQDAGKLSVMLSNFGTHGNM